MGAYKDIYGHINGQLLEAIGLDENTTAVYPDYFRSPVYLPPKGEKKK